MKILPPRHQGTPRYKFFLRVPFALFAAIFMVVFHEGLLRRPRPETMKSQETEYKVTNFFYNKPLVYLGALVPWWLFSYRE
jgi:hypothetical protein